MFFPNLARCYQPGFAAIIKLAELFGASIHAAFRLYVESNHQAVAGLCCAGVRLVLMQPITSFT